jgi:hypothetical protein
MSQNWALRYNSGIDMHIQIIRGFMPFTLSKKRVEVIHNRWRGNISDYATIGLNFLPTKNLMMMLMIWLTT